MQKFYKLFAVIILIAFSFSQVVATTLPHREKTSWCKFSAAELQGNIKIPVVFVNFTNNPTFDSSIYDWTDDDAITVTPENQAKWIEQLNEKCSNNFLDENGSVNDFFSAQSYGKLNVTFEKVGVINGGDAFNLYEYEDQAKMAKTKLATLQGVNWSNYDSNGDGEVDCILLIYAGHAEGDYTPEGNVNVNVYPNRNWFSNLTSSKLSLGSVVADSYVFVNDLRDSSSEIDGIATVSHELGHGMFDLNDYYKSVSGTIYSNVGQFDAMDFGFRQLSNYGVYMPKGEHPCSYTAFNRMYLGWLNPIELTEACTVTLRPLGENADAAVIFDPDNANHFFLLEYRKKTSTSWDAHLPSEGLVVTEIHYDANKFNFHNVNSGNPRNIQLIDANTGGPIAIASSSYYDYNQANVAFGEEKTSIPTSVSSIFSTKTVSNIKINKEKGTISFDFMGGGKPVSGIEEIANGSHNDGEYVKKELINGVFYITKNNVRYNIQGQAINE